MLDPNTAPKKRSIWTEVDRLSFENQTQVLDTNSHVAGPRTYSRPKNNKSYPFPVAIEEELSSDFAFIAAHWPGAKGVSAATIEVNQAESSLFIRLAFNEGIHEPTPQSFNEITRILRQCALKKISREVFRSRLFKEIVNLNEAQILRRLKPGRVPLATRFHNSCDAYIRMGFFTGACVQVPAFEEQFSRFRTACAQLQDCLPDETGSRLQAIIKAAYDLSHNHRKPELHTRLQLLGVPPSEDINIQVNALHKVARYWRVCVSLAEICRRYREYFSTIRWTAIEPYMCSFSPVTGSKLYVHAEIQLLVYYETHIYHLKPRYISSSKNACFLCDSFLRAHKGFSFTEAHRQTFRQWTVPDLKEYDLRTVELFRRSLLNVAQDVEVEYHSRNRATYPRKPVAQLSCVNFDPPTYSTASETTVCSPRPSRTNSASTLRPTPTVPRTILEEENMLQIDDLTEANIRSSGGRISPSRESMQPMAFPRDGAPSQSPITSETNDQHEFLPVPKEVAIHSYSNWLHLHTSLSERALPPSGPSPPSEFRPLTMGRIRFRQVIGHSNTRIISTDDLALGREVVLERDHNDDTSQSLSFILQKSANQKVLVCCRWD